VPPVCGGGAGRLPAHGGFIYILLYVYIINMFMYLLGRRGSAGRLSVYGRAGQPRHQPGFSLSLCLFLGLGSSAESSVQRLLLAGALDAVSPRGQIDS
jgi:hypothetical protein